MYEAVFQETAPMNNVSEEWHNRFQVIIGRYYPSLYSFLTERIQEQGDTETMLAELNLGQKI